MKTDDPNYLHIQVHHNVSITKQKSEKNDRLDECSAAEAVRQCNRFWRCERGSSVKAEKSHTKQITHEKVHTVRKNRTGRFAECHLKHRISREIENFLEKERRKAITDRRREWDPVTILPSLR